MVVPVSDEPLADLDLEIMSAEPDGQLRPSSGRLRCLLSLPGQAIDRITTQDSGSVGYDDGGVQYSARFRFYPLTDWRLVVAWPKP